MYVKVLVGRKYTLKSPRMMGIRSTTYPQVSLKKSLYYTCIFFYMLEITAK